MSLARVVGVAAIWLTFSCAGVTESGRQARVAAPYLSPEQLAGAVQECRQTIADLGGPEGDALGGFCTRAIAAAGQAGMTEGAVLWLAVAHPAPTAEMELQLLERLNKVYAAQGLVSPGIRIHRIQTGSIDDPRLYQGLGAALRATAVVYEHENSLHAVPVMPLASRLVLEVPNKVVFGGKRLQALSALVLAGRADLAFARVDMAGAYVLGTAALDLLTANFEPCTLRGPILYLVDKAARQGGGESDDSNARYQSECLDAQLSDPAELDAQAFLKLLYDFESRRGSSWKKDDLPEDWKTTVGRQAAMKDLGSRSKALKGHRGELARALFTELQAFLREPEDVCDQATDKEKKRIASETARTIFQLGRRDLSSHIPGSDAQSVDQMDEAYFDLLKKKVYDPRDRWKFVDGMNGLLFSRWALAGMGPPPSSNQVYCDDLFGELNRQFDQDRWPEAADRNLSRLGSVFTSSVACADRSAIHKLYQRALDEASEGERGKVGVLVAILGMTPDLFMALMSGQQHQLMVGLQDLHQAVEGQLSGLGDSDEDKALGAMLRVFLTLKPALTGQMGQALARLEESEQMLGALPFPPAADSPTLVRLAPGSHLISGYLLALSRHFLGQSDKVAPVLARMRQGLDRAVPFSMAALDASAHSGPALKVVMAVQDMLEYGLGPEDKDNKSQKLERALKAIDSAWPELDSQSGSWSLGLAAGQIVLNDLAALLFDEQLPAGRKKEILSASTGRLEQLVRAGVGRYELHSMDWDFVHLLPVVHEVMERFLLSDPEGKNRFWTALFESAPRLEGVLSGMAPSRKAEDRLKHLVEAGSMPSVLMEFLWAAQEVGLDKIKAEDKKALDSLANRMERLDQALSQANRKSLRTIMAVTVGMVLTLKDEQADSLAWLDRAQQAVQGSDLEKQSHYLGTLRASVLAHSDALRASKQLRQAIKKGDRALSCGKTHPVHSLHVPLAWMAERSGEHKLALAQLDRYLALVEKGFPGEGVVECKYVFESDNFTFNTTIKAALSNLVQSTSNEQSFQVGAGAQSNLHHRERLVCTAVPQELVRHDRVLNALLMGASYSLLNADDKAADTYLRRARLVLRRINNGSKATLDERSAAGLEPARENMYRPLLYWTGVLAQLRGHMEIGEELESKGRYLDRTEERLEDLRLKGERYPAYLGGLPKAEALRKLLALWFMEDPGRNGFSKKLKSLLVQAAQKGDVVADFAPLLLEANYQVGQGELGEGKKILGRAKGKLARNVLLRRLIVMIDAIQSSKLPKHKKLIQLLSETGRQGFVPATMKACAVLSGTVIKERGLEAGLEMYQEAHKPLEPVMDVLTHGLVQQELAKVFLAAGKGPQTLQALIRSVELLNGLIPFRDQLSRQYQAVKLGLQLDQLAVVQANLPKWLPSFEKALGSDSPVALTLRGAQLALAAGLQGQVEPAELERVLAMCIKRGPEVAQVRTFLEKLKEALAAQKNVQKLCKEYLIFVIKS